jgi:hypothetical protein
MIGPNRVSRILATTTTSFFLLEDCWDYVVCNRGKALAALKSEDAAARKVFEGDRSAVHFDQVHCDLARRLEFVGPKKARKVSVSDFQKKVASVDSSRKPKKAVAMPKKRAK